MTKAAQSSGQNGHSAEANGTANGHSSEGHPLTNALYQKSVSYPNHTNTKTLTTNSGMPVPDNDHSLTVGPRGPVLLEDSHLLEKLAQFNRERIPERIVHARGMTAKGYFEVTADITDLTSADLFSEVGKRTEVATRFSTVTHGRESPESLRDVRGFSVKWYTKEGNWDLVGNNIPVFFVRDGKKFVDLNHALKPNPVTFKQEGWRILDFLTHHPESTHTLSWLLDLNGIPTNWRDLEGHGVNTYALTNREGKETLVKFHWLPPGGPKYMTEEDVPGIVTSSPPNAYHSHATVDLVESIKSGNPPSWNFYIQTMDPADQLSHDFDPLDATKIWPEDKFPMKQVGKMVLDQHITNHFVENEQVAFSPANLVPGIAPSNDKLLQSRLHAYHDAQRYRLGINWQNIPINKPKWPYHDNHNEGQMNYLVKDEEVNYWPSNREHQGEGIAEHHASVTSEQLGGHKVMTDLPKATEDPQYDFRQAGERWRTIISKDESRVKLFIGHIVGWMSMPQCEGRIRDTWLSYWSQVDKDLGAQVKSELQKALKSQ